MQQATTQETLVEALQLLLWFMYACVAQQAAQMLRSLAQSTICFPAVRACIHKRNFIIWRCGHAKLGVVVQKSHVRMQSSVPPLLKSCLHPCVCVVWSSWVLKYQVSSYYMFLRQQAFNNFRGI